MPHQNVRLQNHLLRYWNYVDDVRFRDIAQVMVESYLRLEQKLFGKFPSYRWLGTALVVSTIVTTVVLILGRTFGVYLTALCGGSITRYGNLLESFFVMLAAGVSYFRYNIDHGTIYALNITFDAITMTLTLMFLRVYVSHRRFLPKYFLVLADIATCIVLLYTCMYFAFYADRTTSGVKHTFWTFYEHILLPIRSPECGHFHIFTSTILFSSTVLVPTLTYLTAILLFMTAKASLEISRWIVAHVLELGATQKKTVFFYTGVYIGLLSSGVTLIIEIGKAIGN